MHSPDTNSAADWLDVAEMISLCGRRLRATLAHALTQEGLGDAQFSMLWGCTKATADGVNQRHLADMLSVSPAHVSATLEQLRRLGLLCSRRCSDDRRRQMWVVTPDGREVVHRVTNRLQPYTSQLESELGSQARHDLQSTLLVLIASVDRQENGKPDDAHLASSYRERAA